MADENEKTHSLEILKKNREKQQEAARQKAVTAIRELEIERKSINFSSVSKRSGVSRSFLYDDMELRKFIEQHRETYVKHDMNQRAKYDKTSSSKDVIIKAKERHIAKLEEENQKLKAELMHLRALLYESK